MTDSLIYRVWDGTDWNPPVSPPLSDEALAFLSTTGITDPTISDAISDLVVDLKAASIWTKLHALYPMVGGTATTHKFNLIDPRDLDAAFRLSFSGSWTHSGNGAAPDGSSAYANTHFNDSTSGWTGISASFGVYSRTNSATATCYDMGLADSDDTPTTILACRYSTNSFYGVHRSSTFPSVGSFDGRGFFVGGRVGNQQQAYKNGSQVMDTTEAAATDLNLNLYLGACNKNGTATYFSPKEQALAFVGEGMTEDQQADFYTAVQTFQTTLGREV